jgi:ketosteroid isomerase-like protein
VPENVTVVQSVYDAFGRGDVQALFGLFHPKGEIYQSSWLPWGGVYRGNEGLGDFIGKLTGVVESRVDTERYIDDEEGHVVAVGHTRGRVRATGREFDVPETHVWTIKKGNEVRGVHRHPDDARGSRALDFPISSSASPTSVLL